MFAIDSSDPLPIYAQLDRAIRLAVATGKLRQGRSVADGAAACGRSADQRQHRGQGLRRAGTGGRRGNSAGRRHVRAGSRQTARLSLSDRQQQLVALADDFLTKAAVLGFTPHEAVDLHHNSIQAKEMGEIQWLMRKNASENAKSAARGRQDSPARKPNRRTSTSISVVSVLVAGGLGIGVGHLLERSVGWLSPERSSGLIAAFSPKVAQQWERAIVLRLGRYVGMRGPGLFWIVPGIDRSRAGSISARSPPASPPSRL